MLFYSHNSSQHRQSQSVSSYSVFESVKIYQVEKNSFQPVQFIPGVPGTHHRKIPPAPPNHAGGHQVVDDRVQEGLHKNDLGHKNNIGALPDTTIRFLTKKRNNQQLKTEKQSEAVKVGWSISDCKSLKMKKLEKNFPILFST